MSPLSKRSLSHKRTLPRSLHGLYGLLFVVCSLLLSSQTLSDQIQTWNTQNVQKTSVDSVDFAMDWIDMTLTTRIQLSWTYKENAYLLPQDALRYSEKLFPEVLVFGLASIPAEDQHSLLQQADIKNISATLFVTALDNSMMQEYLAGKNIFSSSLVYSTNILPLSYELFLPNYSPVEIPKTLDITHKTKDSYSSIIFATDTAIPYISNTDLMLEFTPKLFPKVYGHDNQIVFSPAYYQAPQTSTINTGRSFTYFTIDKIHEMVLGENPLVVLPLYLNSDMQGDIVISSSDTLTILSNPQIQLLIQEGKVFFALPKKQYTILKSNNSVIDGN